MRGSTLGLLGAMFGSFVWMVLLGIVIGSPWLIVLPWIPAAVAARVGSRLHAAIPERGRCIAGLALVWAALFNVAAINLVYDRVPETALGISTGKGGIGLLGLNALLVALGVLGFGIAVRDLLNARADS